VDLVLLDEAGPGLAYRVFRDGRVVFVRDRSTLVDRVRDVLPPEATTFEADDP
jgi:hypothetical protein